MIRCILAAIGLSWFASSAFAAGESKADLEIKNSSRTRQRLVYFSSSPKQPVCGQITSEVSRSTPESTAITALEQASDGTRRNLGAGFWATFDTNVPLTIAGVKVKPGYYYCALEKGSVDEWRLVLLAADGIQPQRMDATDAGEAKGGIVIPLKRESDDKSVPTYMFVRVLEPTKDPKGLRLEVRHGPLRLIAEAEPELKQHGNPVVMAEERSRSCILKPAEESSLGGRISIEHGLPDWTADRGKQIASLKPKSRWRLGQNYWTNLDANVDFTLGGTKVPAGQYFLVVEKQAANQWQLVLLDPKKIRADTMDAFQADDTKGGLKIPLEASEDPAEAKKLAIQFAKGKDAGWKLEIRFGPHRLETSLEM